MNAGFVCGVGSCCLQWSPHMAGLESRNTCCGLTVQFDVSCIGSAEGKDCHVVVLPVLLTAQAEAAASSRNVSTQLRFLIWTVSRYVTILIRDS